MVTQNQKAKNYNGYICHIWTNTGSIQRTTAGLLYLFNTRFLFHVELSCVTVKQGFTSFTRLCPQELELTQNKVTKDFFFFRFVKMATRGKQRPRLWGRSSQHFVVKVRKNASQEIISKKPVRIWRLSFRQFHSCTRWVKRTVAACAVVWLLCVLCEGRLGFLP